MDENASSAIGSLNRKKPVACPAEGPGGQGPPYFKNAPPLSQGLDDPPPTLLIWSLDPPLEA